MNANPSTADFDRPENLSTGSCRGWNSTGAYSKKRLIPPNRCSSASASCPSSAPTWTSSSRSASPGSSSRSRARASWLARTTAPPRRSLPRRASGRTNSSNASTAAGTRTSCPPSTRKIFSSRPWTRCADALAWTDRLFSEELFPVLTPLAVDPSHPFPQLLNKSHNLIVRLHHPEEGETLTAIVQIPRVLPRLLLIPEEASRDLAPGLALLSPSRTSSSITWVGSSSGWTCARRTRSA